jgi:RND family efflux transporter MFP subunit
MNALARIVRPMYSLIQVLIPIGFLALGLFAAVTLFTARTSPPRADREEVATVVRIMDVASTDVRLDVEAWGEVKAERTLVLQPQVSGRITSIAASLSPGSVLPAGALVATIESRDFELGLQQAQSALATAQFNLEVERGRGRIAQRDWELLGDIAGDLQLNAESSTLALRAPHLREREAMVESAQSAVEQAQLALDRTNITVPFRAMVQSRTGVEGSMVSPSSIIATLVGTDAWWVEVSVPIADLERVKLPDLEGRGGGEATVEVRLANGPSATYHASIARLTGSVDAAGRQARILLRIEDPLGQSQSQRIPLLLGGFVHASLEGPSRSDVYELPRSVLHDGDVLWIRGLDQRLDIRKVDVLGSSLDTVIVDLELKDGEAIISSTIATPVKGLLLVDNTRA